MKKSKPLLRFLQSTLLLIPLVGISLALTACDPRTPKEKASDGISKIGDGKVSEGLDDMGEAAKDATKKD